MKRRILASLLAVLLPAAATLVAWHARLAPEEPRPAPAAPATPAVEAPARASVPSAVVTSPPAAPGWPALRYELPVRPQPFPAVAALSPVPGVEAPSPVRSAHAAAEPVEVNGTAESGRPRAFGVPAPDDAEKALDKGLWERVSPLLSPGTGLGFYVPDASPGTGVWVPAVLPPAVGAGLRFRWSF